MLIWEAVILEMMARRKYLDGLQRPDYLLLASSTYGVWKVECIISPCSQCYCTAEAGSLGFEDVRRLAVFDAHRLRSIARIWWEQRHHQRWTAQPSVGRDQLLLVEKGYATKTFTMAWSCIENACPGLAVPSIVWAPWIRLEGRAWGWSSDLVRRDEANRMTATRRAIMVAKLGQQESRGSLIYSPYRYGAISESVAGMHTSKPPPAVPCFVWYTAGNRPHMKYAYKSNGFWIKFME